MKKSLLIHPDELSRKWIDRMLDNDVQVLGLHPTGGKTAHESLEAMLALLETPDYRRLLDYAAERGLEIEYAFHAASFLVPRPLFAEHPEYFRIDRNGERTPQHNFCVSCDEAMQMAVNRAVEISRKLYRSAPRFHFWLDDDRDAKCFCPKCRGLSASDQQLLAVNAIAKALRKEDVRATVSYLAYFEALQPPVHVKPAEGVYLEYAPIDRDMKKNVWEMPQEEQDNIRRLLDFFGKEKSLVLEYWYDNSMFSRWKKPPRPFSVNGDMVREDISWYKALGFEDISCFACFLGEDYEALYGEPDIAGYRQ